MIVINLFGAPGSGKSTGAAYIYSMLKMKGYNAELITEFAKDKAYEHNTTALSVQPYVFGEQLYRMERCRYEADIIVTDSPLLLALVYDRERQNSIKQTFRELVYHIDATFTNLNYLIKRNKPYVGSGMLHTENESNMIHDRINGLLLNYGYTYSIHNGDLEGYNEILNDVVARIENLI